MAMISRCCFRIASELMPSRNVADETSPLAEMLERPQEEQDFLIYASVGGFDRTTGQAAHDFQGYGPEHLLQGGQFVDAVEDIPGGGRRLRLDLLDKVAAGEMADDPLQMYLADIFTLPPSLAGLPAISTPAGLGASSKLPIGVQFTGRAFEESTVIRAAAVLEAAMGALPAPG